MRASVIAFALVLAACGQSTQQSADTPIDAPAAQDLVLACADFATLTPDALAQRYGAENITTQTMPGPEGESYEATLVFADDPARRFEIVWNEAGAAPASVSANTVGTAWTHASGLTVGDTIAEVEALNVMPFKLWGFGWDYGGWVSDWNLGTFSQTPGCTVMVRFDPRNETSTGAMGDSEFVSNDPAVRAADPVVSKFTLMFATAE